MKRTYYRITVRLIQYIEVGDIQNTLVLVSNYFKGVKN